MRTSPTEVCALVDNLWLLTRNVNRDRPADGLVQLSRISDVINLWLYLNRDWVVVVRQGNVSRNRLARYQYIVVRNVNCDVNYFTSMTRNSIRLNRLTRWVNVVYDLALFVSRVVNSDIRQLSVKCWIIDAVNRSLTSSVARYYWNINVI